MNPLFMAAMIAEINRVSEFAKSEGAGLLHWALFELDMLDYLTGCALNHNLAGFAS